MCTILWGWAFCPVEYLDDKLVLCRWQNKGVFIMAKAGKSSIKRRPATTNVYMIGSGIGSLAAAIYLIRDARVPGKNIKA